MKFGQYLLENAVPEWQHKYIDYRVLKKAIKKIEARKQQEAHIRKDEYAPQKIGNTGDNDDDGEEMDEQMGEPVGSIPMGERIEIRINDGSALGSQRDDSAESSSGDLAVPLRRKSFKSQLPEQSSNSLKFFFKKRRRSLIKETEYFPDFLETANEEEVLFFAMLNQEVQKANQFYEEKLQEANRRFEELQEQCKAVTNYQFNQWDSASALLESEFKTLKNKLVTKIDSVIKPRQGSSSQGESSQIRTHLELPQSFTETDISQEYVPVSKNIKAKLTSAILEYYRFLELIKNFKTMCVTAVYKIMKKFDKVSSPATQLYIPTVEHLSLFEKSSEKIDGLMTKIENVFSDCLLSGDRKLAMKKLRIPDLAHQTHHFVTWRSGFFLGLSLPPIVATIRAIWSLPDIGSLDMMLLQIYAGFSIPILFLFLFALNLIIWQKYHINYVFIFEFDPRDHLSPHQFSEFGSFLILLFSCALYLSLVDNFFPGIEVQLYPIILCAVILLLMSNPFKFFYRSSRFWLMRSIGRIITSGVWKVEFRDFFICDLLSSMTYSFVALELMACLIINNPFDTNASTCDLSTSYIVPIIAGLPSFWRLIQCIRRYYDNSFARPHLLNGIKYLLSLSVIILSAVSKIQNSIAIRILWIIFASITTIYAYVWDTTFDFNLLQRKYGYLREELVYPWKAFYYFAIVSNFILRMTWIITISPNNWGIFWDSKLLIYFLAILELFRRFQWNLIRMENEHTSNIGNFRATKDIPLPFRRRMAPQPPSAVEDTEEPKESIAERSETRKYRLLDEKPRAEPVPDLNLS